MAPSRHSGRLCKELVHRNRWHGQISRLNHDNSQLRWSSDSLPMEVRRVKANDQVEDDRGKLAIERGPIMFCLEGQDQADSSVFNKFIPDGTDVYKRQR